MTGPARAGAFVLLAVAALMPARAARAEEPPVQHNELSFDVGAASFGMTHAWRTHAGGVLIGGGGAAGLYPLLGAHYATGTHFDDRGVFELGEFLHVQLFARFEPVSWLRADGGVRAGFFVHGSEKVSGGEFVGLFVAPALAWRWLWVGPRVSGNLLREHTGESASVLMIEYVMLRFVRSW